METEWLEEADAVLVGLGDEWKAADVNAYDRLRTMLSGKNYFIVTMCSDGRINDSSIDSMHFVDPCGSVRRLQCPDGCEDYIVPAPEDDTAPVCPHCGKPLVPNVAGIPHYVEAGYQKQWELYTKWLTFGLNKKVVALELGVGFRFPTVIRFAFERIVMINQKASLVRVHETLAQIPEPLAGRGTGIFENSVHWVERQTGGQE